MRFPISISAAFRPLFALFGFRARSSYVELEDDALVFRFGTAHERVPLSAVAGVGRTRWPFYYGLGAKLGPDEGVAYVGSMKDVVRVDLRAPQPMNVWGPFARAAARNVIVSVEDGDGFIAALQRAIAARNERA